MLVKLRAKGEQYCAEHMQERNERSSNVGHSDQRHPDGEQTTVEITKLQYTNLHQTEAELFLATVASVICAREEHGEKVDDGFGEVFASNREVDAWYEEEITQCEQQRGSCEG